MIKNKHKLDNFYQRLMEEENITHKEALLIYEQLHSEAVSLGVINSKSILEGLEVDIKIARTLKALSQYQ